MGRIQISALVFGTSAVKQMNLPSRDQSLASLKKLDSSNNSSLSAPLEARRNKSNCFFRLEEKTIMLPSGDQIGHSSGAESNVNRVHTARLISYSQMSVAPF